MNIENQEMNFTQWTMVKFAFPLGTIVIQEIAAPEGYQINPEVIVRRNNRVRIKEEEIVDSYQNAQIPEQVLTLDIVKVQKETMTPIAGAKFIHTMPDGSREEVMTDGQGKAALKGLIRGEHMVEESFVPDGYTRNPEKSDFKFQEIIKLN